MAVTLTTTPTYTAALAYEAAQEVSSSVDYDFSSTRDKALRLILSYDQGRTPEIEIRSSKVDDTGYIVETTSSVEQVQGELSETPVANSEAIRSVQYRESHRGPFQGYGRWEWDSESGELTVEDGNRFYRVSYWYDDVLEFEDLTESTDYYARVFLTDLLGGADQYEYIDGTVSETGFAKRFTPDYDTDTTLFDIDPNYGSAGNVFTNVLRAQYLSYTGVSSNLSDFGSEATPASDSTESSESVEDPQRTEVEGASSRLEDDSGSWEQSEGMTSLSATNVLRDLGYDY